MKLSFDYYHNLEETDLYLCNPDGKELYSIPAKNRNFTLRFNDLSELTFDVYAKINNLNGELVEFEGYDDIQTLRLVYATNIGWFQIASVSESSDGKTSFKTVTAMSYQSTLKNKGFVSEERVYCFYNPNDPFDSRYDSLNEGSVPSVLGQMYRQLGIRQDLSSQLEELTSAYDEWTVVYVTPSLVYDGAGSRCRTFKDNVTYGYDWIVNDVEDAFEILVLFDFMHKGIYIVTPEEVTQRVNVIYTFNNFMKNIKVDENSEDIVTVLNCNGENCDITAVNPTGTNYICDFSYYMDVENEKWMSLDLINKLNEWKAECDDKKELYTNTVTELRGLFLQKTECLTSLQENSLALQDLKNAQSKRSVAGDGTPGELCGVVAAEKVKTNGNSIYSGSRYYRTDFKGSTTIVAYQNPPTYNSEAKTWSFSGATTSGTADSIVSSNLSSGGTGYWYFSDVSDGMSYCRLTSGATVNTEDTTSKYHCTGYERYIAFTYPQIEGGKIIYTDQVQYWISLREKIVNNLNNTNATLERNINSKTDALNTISNSLNILSYFSNTPLLLRELNCYWIEGDYTNENITVFEDTTLEEEIDLANELLESGYLELSKVCQPRFKFSVDSIDALKMYEFSEQMSQLELGKVVTVEKEEGIWYYPALIEMSINLDEKDNFSLVFANATRLDDWGYTYADLMADSSATSRKVSANWQNLTSYAKDKEKISSIIDDPLNATLRAATANMVNQEFTTDSTGILGRKKTSENATTFEDEQVRIINNSIIFTRDNWQTASTALGKIYYLDEDGEMVSAYGLIAETIIGELIMTEELLVKNEDGTILLNKDGITVKDPDGEIVFSVGVDGSLIVRNYAKKEELDALGGQVTELGVQITVTAEKVESKADKTVVDELNDTVTIMGTTITQTAEAITLKADKTVVDELSNTVTTMGTTITQTAEAITSKADKTVVDELSDTVTTMGTTITQTAEQIESKADKTAVDSLTGVVVNLGTTVTQTSAALTSKADKTVVDELSDTVANMGTTINQTAEQVLIKADKTTVDDLADRVSAAESEILVNAEEISAKVSATYMTDSETFGWRLYSGGFNIYSETGRVFSVTKKGLEVKGDITAETGYIGDWVIGGDDLYSTTLRGIYPEQTYEDSYLKHYKLHLTAKGLFMNQNIAGLDYKPEAYITWGALFAKIYELVSSDSGSKRFKDYDMDENFMMSGFEHG